MYKTLILEPRMSEKSYGLSQTRTYVFDVPGELNKHSVARAVAAQFDVVVANVNIANIAGKAKRTVYKGGRRVNGREADTKKAYVTLAEGHSLPIFAAIEEEEAKQEAKQEKIDKAVAKAEVKATKKSEKKPEITTETPEPKKQLGGQMKPSKKSFFRRKAK